MSSEQMQLDLGPEFKTVEDLNPKSQAVKSMEMTVLRALQLYEAFSLLEKDQDWQDVPGATYRKILGERYEHAMLLSVCYDRFRKGTLQREVLDLAANLPPASLERKEIADGLSRINQEHTARNRRARSRDSAGGPRDSTSRRTTRPRRKSA